MKHAACWTRRVAMGLLTAGAVTLTVGLSGCQGAGGGGQVTPATDPSGPAMQAKYQQMMDQGKNKAGGAGTAGGPVMAPTTAPAGAPKTGTTAPPGPK